MQSAVELNYSWPVCYRGTGKVQQTINFTTAVIRVLKLGTMLEPFQGLLCWYDILVSSNMTTDEIC
jgi:hypothetical protein